MDIIEKCQLVTSSRIDIYGRGHDYDLTVEIYTEIKEEIIQKLESMSNSIIEQYKKCVKNQFFRENGVNMEFEIEKNLDLLEKNKTEISNYIRVLEIVEERIAKSKKELADYKKTTTVSTQEL